MPTLAGIIAGIVTLIAIPVGFLLYLQLLGLDKGPVPPSLEWLPKFIVGAALGGAVAAFYVTRAWAKGWNLRRVSPHGNNRAQTDDVSRSQKKPFDREKWDALLNYDNDIATVAAKLRPLGDKWVDEFARHISL